MQPDPVLLEMGPVSDTLLEELAAQLVAHGPSGQTIQGLREAYPQIRFLLCSEDDVGEKTAYRSYPGFDVFLMAGGWGCACLTDAIEASVGLVIATHEG